MFEVVVKNIKKDYGNIKVIHNTDSHKEKFFFEKKDALGLINQINHPAKIRRVNQHEG